MRRSIQAITTATIAGAMLAFGSGMAVAAPAPAGADVDAYSVPAAETAAAATAWSADRMEAAVPADALVLDQIDELDATAAPDGAATTYAAEQPVLQATRVSPVSHIGKVFFTLGGVDYVCSANSVTSANGNTVSTAGHCLNEGPGDFASEFIFVPAYENGAAPYGQWPAVELVAPTQWTDGGDINYDTGFAVVSSQGGRTLAATVGASGVSFNQSDRTVLHALRLPRGASLRRPDAAAVRGHGLARPHRRHDVAGRLVRHDRRLVGRPLVHRLGLRRRAELREQLRLQHAARRDVRPVLGLRHPGRVPVRPGLTRSAARRGSAIAGPLRRARPPRGGIVRADDSGPRMRARPSARRSVMG